jgi:hypothetical protein
MHLHFAKHCLLMRLAAKRHLVCLTSATSVLEPSVFLTATSGRHTPQFFTAKSRRNKSFLYPLEQTFASRSACRATQLADSYEHGRLHQCHQQVSSNAHVCDVITPTLHYVTVTVKLSAKSRTLHGQVGRVADVFNTSFLACTQRSVTAST